MTDNQSVIEALRSAHEGAPNNNEIALHLASLLLASAEYSESLKLFQSVLAREPGSEPSLRGALQCAEAQNDAGLAEAYRHSADSIWSWDGGASDRSSAPSSGRWGEFAGAKTAGGSR